METQVSCDHCEALRERVETWHTEHVRFHESERRAKDVADSLTATHISKAEQNLEARLHGLNEFRAAMADQSKHYVTREVLDVMSEARNRRLEAIEVQLAQLAGRDKGIGLAWVVLLAVAGVITGIIGVVWKG